MKIVVGLGNPGDEYGDTPHNLGFKVVDELAGRCGCRFRRSLRLRALTARCGTGEGAGFMLVKPQTFMNLAGECAGAVLRYCRSDATDLVVVTDDADLPQGALRIRAGGGSAGHRGLISIIEHVGMEEFARLRIGIGRREGADLRRHVLGRFSKKELEQMAGVVQVAADAVMKILESGVDAAMNEYNGRVIVAPDGEAREDGVEEEV